MTYAYPGLMAAAQEECRRRSARLGIYEFPGNIPSNTVQNHKQPQNDAHRVAILNWLRHGPSSITSINNILRKKDSKAPILLASMVAEGLIEEIRCRRGNGSMGRMWQLAVQA